MSTAARSSNSAQSFAAERSHGAVAVHIFDVDHTIVRGSTVRQFIFEGLARRMIPLSIGPYALYFFLLYNVTGPRSGSFDKRFPFFRDVEVTRIEELARATYLARIEPRLDVAVVDLIRSLLAAGLQVLLASSSFRFILEPLARHLGVGEMIVSELEIREGRTTGRLEGSPAYRSDKKSRVLDYLAGRGIDPADCSFYSDSIHDLPLLESVGHPVAVNPDGRLRRRARAYGWETLTT